MIIKSITVTLLALILLTPVQAMDAGWREQTTFDPAPIPVEPVEKLKPLEKLEPAKFEEIATVAKVKESAPKRSSTPQQSVGGTPQEWMKAAGIPQSDWTFVDCVINGCQGVSAEGGWNGTQRWNTAGSGAYGLCQSLPASKMASAGADYMTNPVTQLKWCHGYAQQYGGWAAAWNFRKCVGSCYSARTGGYASKDHTWW